jgi:antitoxin VapB
MPSIRDEAVPTLAEMVMQRSGAPNLTPAIRRALRNEIRCAKALSRATKTPQAPLTKAERDDLWGA